MLATLTAYAGRLVSVDTLVDRVWGEAPPERARRMLHPHITRIRRMFGRLPAGATPVRLSRHPGGYLLEVAPEQVDLHRFQRLLRQANAKDCLAEERLALLAEALSLWRAEPLAGLSGLWVEQTRQAWQQQRLAAVLTWAEAVLEVGDPAAVIDPLTVCLAEHPLMEPMAVVLMRALATAGRRAEALHCYATARRHLIDELGAEPGPQLRAAHQAILRGEPDLHAAAASPQRSVPAQLPAGVTAFTGRESELGQLDVLLPATHPSRSRTGDPGAGPRVPPATAVFVVSGMAGVGKTALALHWAHRLRTSFPDGQLYVNLRGYDPEQPMTASEVLARFLSALGVPGSAIPLELDDRAARYRTEVAGRRMLIVLDNAATAEQVRPLLPGTDTCAVVVTSRDHLAGLVAMQGAHRLVLDLLPAADAYSLLSWLIGPRADAEPEAVRALGDLCARLPLALRVAAELAVSRSATPLADLVDELADQQHRLDLLDSDGDPHAAVSSVFSWSLQHLPDLTVRAFRLLGLHPAAEFDAAALAALAGITVAEAERALHRLTRTCLVQPAGARRFGMHDLLRAYAARLALTAETEADRTQALDRLLDYYQAGANAAMDQLHPAEAHHRPSTAPSGIVTPAFTDADAARTWLDVERPCFITTTAYAAAHDRPAYAIGMSHILVRYLDGGHNVDAMAVHSHAYEAAQRNNDVAGQAHGLRSLGRVCMRLGRYPKGIQYLRRAMILDRQAGDRLGEARTLTTMGSIEWRLGRSERAADHQHKALALVRQLGDPPAVAGILNNLGVVYSSMSDFEKSEGYFREALALYQGIRAAETVSGRRLADRYGEAQVLDSLGTVHLRLGQFAPAAECFRQALALFRGIGNRDGEAWVFNGLGEAGQAAGSPADAVEHHTAALAIATDIGSLDQQARAHAGLGHAFRTLGDATRAHHHYASALALYTELDCPEAGNIRAALAGTSKGEAVHVVVTHPAS